MNNSHSVSSKVFGSQSWLTLLTSVLIRTLSTRPHQSLSSSKSWSKVLMSLTWTFGRRFWVRCSSQCWKISISPSKIQIVEEMRKKENFSWQLCIKWSKDSVISLYRILRNSHMSFQAMLTLSYFLSLRQKIGKSTKLWSSALTSFFQQFSNL